jgi:Ca2+-transporting ATPase
MEGLLALEVGRAWAIRTDRLMELGAEELVPGDVIVVEAGQAVPADARLLGATELAVVEAALTGESAPVAKDAEIRLPESTTLPERRAMIYRATAVAAGRGRAVVVATGMATEVGRIGTLTAQVGEEQTPLERRLEALGRPLALTAIIASGLAMLTAWLQGTPFTLALQTAIALAVAAVPEGLPAVATITLALGVRSMARRHALVRRLPSVETLGSTTVICTDKTGTLTAGVMTATALRLADREIQIVTEPGGDHVDFLADGQPLALRDEPRLLQALRIASLANRAAARRENGAWTTIGDPTEAALLVAAHQAGLDPDTFRAEWPEVGEVSFSSERMLMATFHAGPDSLSACVKGAPARVLDLCGQVQTSQGPAPLLPEQRERLLQANRALASRGLRVLALAEGPVERADRSALRSLTFVGVAGMADPPAPGVGATIARFQAAGIRTVMITGDQHATALAVAESLGLGETHHQALDGAALDAMSDAELATLVPQTSVYTRVSPEAKVRLVTALQQSGEVVAMLGDGVNDAAALRKADIGVAMGRRGTDLAKEAADVVLVDDRFATIGVAVEQGRIIHDNVRKAVLYLLACNLAELAVVLVAAGLGWPPPLRPLQILWLNLLTDVLPALALALEPGEPDVMRRPPQAPRAPLVSRPEAIGALGYATLIALVTLAVFRWGQTAQAATGRPMALAFLTLAFAQVFHLGNARQTLHVTHWRRAIANPAALAAVAVTSALLLLAVYWVPLATLLDLHALSTLEWAVVLGSALLPAVIGQALKWRRR